MGMKGRERVDRFFLERRRRLVESFFEKVSGEEIVRNSFSNNLVLEGWLLIMLSSSLPSSLSILYFFWTFMLPTMASICSVWGRRSTSVLRKKSVECMHFGERAEPSCFLPWLQFARSEEGDRPMFWGRRCLLRTYILEKEKAEHRVRVLEKFYYAFFFNICAGVENCGSFKSFGFIYIYIYW